jgi:hypothetical protein
LANYTNTRLLICHQTISMSRISEKRCWCAVVWMDRSEKVLPRTPKNIFAFLRTSSPKLLCRWYEQSSWSN